jgi:hypothetical protein
VANVSNIAVKISGNAQQFIKALEKARKKIDEFQSFVVKGAATVAGSVLAFKKFDDALDYGSDLAKLSRETGVATETIAALQHGIEVLGGSADDISPALLTLNEKITEAANGGFEAQDTFKRLGVGIATLQSLKPDDAFIRVAESLSRIADPTKRAAIATQIFGSQAATLLPLLGKGESGIKQFADEAKKMGLSLSEQEATAMESTKIFIRMRGSLEGVATQIAAKTLPTLVALTQQLGESGKSAITLEEGMQGFAYIAVASAGVIADGFHTVKIAILGIAVAFGEVQRSVTDSASKLARQLSKLPGAEGLKSVANELDASYNNATDKIKDIKRELAKEVSGLGRGPKWADDFLNGLQQKIAEITKKLREDRGANGAVEKQRRNDSLFTKASQTIQDNLSPLQAFTEQFQSLNAQLAAGAIGWDTYAKASSKAIANLEAANQLSNISLPGANAAGSAGAYSAIVKSQAESDLRMKENPQERIKRVLDSSLEIHKKQLEYAKQVAEALKKRRDLQVITV